MYAEKDSYLKKEKAQHIPLGKVTTVSERRAMPQNKAETSERKGRKILNTDFGNRARSISKAEGWLWKLPEDEKQATSMVTRNASRPPHSAVMLLSASACFCSAGMIRNFPLASFRDKLARRLWL